MDRRPGTPRLLRELNDRAALELLLTGGPMTRAQLGERTGLSKVTASQLLARLEDRGLVEVAGEQAGGRGPNAAIYGVVPSSAYVAGLHVEIDEVRAGISPEALRAFVIGTPGVLDPRTGDLWLAVNLPAWHEGVHEALSADLGRPVTIENDVNLAAMAERAGRVALGVAAVSVGLDPGLVVLGGDVGLAGGVALASRVAAEVGRISPAKPRVVPTAVSGKPVLRGAILAAVDAARAELLASV